MLKGYEFICIAPQCPAESYWPVMTEELFIFLKHCIDTLPVDTGRIYLTGLSMGGYGTWQLAMQYPKAFAAIAPICGGTWPIGLFLEKIKHIPTWVFHGAKDSVVPFSQSATPVALLNEMNANIKFTAYPELDHDSWTITYENPKFYEWLFSQKNTEYRL